MNPGIYMTSSPQTPNHHAPQIPIAGGPLDRQHMRRPRAARGATAILPEAHGVVGGVELLDDPCFGTGIL